MIQLGDRVKDSITGITGIAVARTHWLHGCDRITVQPEKLDEGKMPESVTIDEPQLVLVKAKQVLPGKKDTGGPKPEPQRKATPSR